MSIWVKNFKRLLIRTGFIFFISISCVFPCAAKENTQTEKAAESNTLDENSESTRKSDEGSFNVYVKETPLIDTGISGVSAILSFIAIFVSIYSVSMTKKMTKDTINLQKQHNRDEVRPLLCIHFDATNMSIVLRNHGLGPAIIKSMKWYDANNEEPTLVKLNTNKWKKSKVKDIYYYTKEFSDIKEDPDILAPQESLCFIKCDYDDYYNKKRIAESFADVKMELTYTDIYESQEWTVKKDCSWFYHQYYQEQVNC